MIGPCPAVCSNKSASGYCLTTSCIHPIYFSSSCEDRSIRDAISFDEAIAMLKSQYDEVKDASWISHPLAYSLYQVWKQVDKLNDEHRYR